MHSMHILICISKFERMHALRVQAVTKAAAKVAAPAFQPLKLSSPVKTGVQQGAVQVCLKPYMLNAVEA